MDLRKPGEEEDEYSEMAEEAMDPDNCFPDSKHTHTQSSTVWRTLDHCRRSFTLIEL